jgi:dienelactone hydrolase
MSGYYSHRPSLTRGHHFAVGAVCGFCLAACFVVGVQALSPRQQPAVALAMVCWNPMPIEEGLRPAAMRPAPTLLCQGGSR